MKEAEQVLYDRISQFSFDEGNEALTFAQRLARENDWTPNYTARVINEYKRFIFLAVVAGHPVTPSDQVDQVWHLHLTYTHSYWDRFCGHILEKPLYHSPTRGGPDEVRKFGHWYQNTRESYARIFGQDPPTDIWPDASIRFGDSQHFQRINTKRNWVIAKPQLNRMTGKFAPLVGGMLAVGLLLGGIIALFTTEVGQIIWTIAFLILIILAFIFHNGCPKCRRNWALERTGRKKGRWFEAKEREWRCKYCGYSEWKEDGCAACGG